MNKSLFDKIKKRIIYHADEKRHRYEIGKGVVDRLTCDIILEFKNFGGLVPPCAIGSTVYTLGHGNSKKPKEWVVIGGWFSVDPRYNYLHIYWHKDKDNYATRQISFDEIGNTVFLTKEEVEKIIEERTKNNANNQ